MKRKDKKINSFGSWFRLCPVRHCILLFGAALIGGYFAFRQNSAVMNAVCSGFTRRWHRFVSGAVDVLPFSFGELLIVAAVLGGAAYLIYAVIRLIRGPDRKKTVYRFLITCLAAFAGIYGGFCLLWGVYYDNFDFEAGSGIKAEPVSVEELTTVTAYFTDLVNTYSDRVQRDESGICCEDLDAIFARSATLYENAEKDMPFLSGKSRHAKPFFFSGILSYTHFTGFFFPFTGEANINIACPVCLIPSTIAHELAHQRGVAAEDEANFAAVFASLESGDPVYIYSSALLAYIHLGNALYKADHDAWQQIAETLLPEVWADLIADNQYWKKFETPVGDAYDEVYTGFLKSYGEERGLQSYGACVDLLCAYYYETACEVMHS